MKLLIEQLNDNLKNEDLLYFYKYYTVIFKCLI